MPLQRRQVLALLAGPACRAENWPQFRGPRGDGTSLERVDSAGAWRRHWRVPLPGPGHSSPIVWGDRIFLTAFEKDATFTGAILGLRGRLLVLCLNLADGKVRWQREAPAASIEKTSSVNQPASPTPATDGVHVFVYLGSFGLLAYDFDGALKWKLGIGPFDNHMGSGSSPVLAGGRLILNAESDGPSFLICVDPRTGKDVWRVPRRTRQTGYSTAFAWKDLVVVAGHREVTAYRAGDGKVAWTAPGLSDYVVPTPVASAGLLYVTSNGPGGGIVMALDAAGQVMWRSAKGGAYVSSPLLAGGRLYTVHHGGVVSCLDAAAGRVIWQQRLTAGGDYYASPIAAGGLVWLVSEAGEVSVIEQGDAYRLRRTESLGDRVYASPAISSGVALLRSNGFLTAIRQTVQ